jgi:hypothetical protein
VTLAGVRWALKRVHSRGLTRQTAGPVALQSDCYPVGERPVVQFDRHHVCTPGHVEDDGRIDRVARSQVSQGVPEIDPRLGLRDIGIGRRRRQDHRLHHDPDEHDDRRAQPDEHLRVRGPDFSGGSAVPPTAAGARCSVQDSPFQCRCPPVPSGSGNQPAGVVISCDMTGSQPCLQRFAIWPQSARKVIGQNRD